MSQDPSHQTPARFLRSQLWSYLRSTHNCHEGNDCYGDCSEFVSDATDEWLAFIQRWGTSGPRIAPEPPRR